MNIFVLFWLKSSHCAFSEAQVSMYTRDPRNSHSSDCASYPQHEPLYDDDFEKGKSSERAGAW